MQKLVKLERFLEWHREYAETALEDMSFSAFRSLCYILTEVIESNDPVGEYHRLVSWLDKQDGVSGEVIKLMASSMLLVAGAHMLNNPEKIEA